MLTYEIIRGMSRPQIISERDVERAAVLYAAGGQIDAIAESFGVRPSTLRGRIRARFGGLPSRLPPVADAGALDRAAALLDAVGIAAQSDEVAYLAREVRTASEAAKRAEGELCTLARFALGNEAG